MRQRSKETAIRRRVELKEDVERTINVLECLVCSNEYSNKRKKITQLGILSGAGNRHQVGKRVLYKPDNTHTPLNEGSPFGNDEDSQVERGGGVACSNT